MTLKGQYSRELYAKIREALTNYGGTGGRPITVTALWLGGEGGEDGGSGGPPGMFIGLLPQTKVCHDTTEAEVDGGSASLLDNLNAMRLMAKRYALLLSGGDDLEDGGDGNGGAAAWTDLTDTPADYTDKGLFYVRVNSGETALEFIEGENGTTRFFVPCIGGYNITAASILDARYSKGIIMPDNQDCQGFGQFTVPEDYLSGMSVTAVVIPDASGNVFSTNGAEYGQCGEAHAAHSHTTGPAAVAITAAVRNCIQQTTLANAAIGDLVSPVYYREGTDALDTVNNNVYFYGWIVEYTASSSPGGGGGDLDIAEVWIKG